MSTNEYRLDRQTCPGIQSVPTSNLDISPTIHLAQNEPHSEGREMGGVWVSIQTFPPSLVQPCSVGFPARSCQSQEETHPQRGVYLGRGPLPRGRRPHPTQYLHYCYHACHPTMCSVVLKKRLTESEKISRTKARQYHTTNQN